MEELNVTLSLFFEIRDARLFGGVGKTGYSKSDLDLCVYNLSGVNLSAYIRDQIKVLADLCKVAPEKIRAVSREVYEENMEYSESPYKDQRWEGGG